MVSVIQKANNICRAKQINKITFSLSFEYLATVIIELKLNYSHFTVHPCTGTNKIRPTANAFGE